LPSASSDLIGRTSAVRHLQDLLSPYRLVSLIGAGGIGKTALALEVARPVPEGARKTAAAPLEIGEGAVPPSARNASRGCLKEPS
jgi:hypothetical protein